MISQNLFIYDEATKKIKELNKSHMFIAGRSLDAQLILTDLACSRRQFKLYWSESSELIIQALSDSNPTFCDGIRVIEPIVIHKGTTIQAGASSFRIIDSMTAEAINHNSLYSDDQFLSNSSIIENRTNQVNNEDFTELPVGKRIIFGSDSNISDEILDSKNISRIHATAYYNEEKDLILEDLGSANGTFLNGIRINSPQIVKVKDNIQLGEYLYEYNGDVLLKHHLNISTHNYLNCSKESSNLIAKDICIIIKDIKLLEDISLEIKKSEFITIIGPSGCGKTTLIRCLSGESKPSYGKVLIQGKDLYDKTSRSIQHISTVPQKEILPALLTVEKALRFTALLRAPANASIKDIDNVLDRVLGTVGLLEHRGKKISRLSGGQLKRVSLANELISDPDIIILDEVTSGLDEQSDREMMALFRQLANSGKTIISITHTLLNVPEYCHRIAVLTKGGRLAFIGSAPEVLRYFEIERLGDIYERLNDRTPLEWAELYKSCKDYNEVDANTLNETIDTNNKETEIAVSFFHQIPLLASRTTHIWFSDIPALSVGLFQPLLVALLLILVFGDTRDTNSLQTTAINSRSILFLTTITSFWLGCNTAVREIVREWPLYFKERRAFLSPAAYLVSKVAVISVFVLIQISIVFILTFYFCNLDGDFLRIAVTLSGVGINGVIAGLFASSLAITESMSLAFLPVLIIPQIIVSDVFHPLKGVTSFFARYFITCHVCFQSVLIGLDDNLEQFVTPVERTSNTELLIVFSIQAFVLIILTWRWITFLGDTETRLLPDYQKRLKRMYKS